MTSLYILAFAALGVLYAAYTRHRIESNRLKSLQKRLEIQNPTIEYDYNRFNTKDERETTIIIQEDNTTLITDIQNISIAEETLVAKISSQYKEIPIKLDVVIRPFEKNLFDIEGYKNFHQEGLLIIWSYGAQTKLPIEQMEELIFLKDKIPMDPGGVYLKLDSFKVDKEESSIILSGSFEDNQEFNLSIYYSSYRLKFSASTKSISNLSNFKNFEELNENEQQ